MFELWLEQEKKAIRLHFENVRVLCIFIVVFIDFSILSLVLLLEGSWVVLLGSIIFSVLLMVFMLSMISDKKQFMEPLMTSVERELTTEESRQEFAKQIQEQAVPISYQPAPQIKPCDIMVAKDYCYVRQPRKCRVIRNNQIRKIILDWEDYYVGNRGHTRWCYALALYTSELENPVWKGYFTDKNTATKAFMQFQEILPSEVVAEDLVAHPENKKKEPQWKFWLEWTLCMLFVAALCLLVRHFQKF
ncbi:MAG: hypothetical protein K2H91_03760 [Lachnospiraceae bacterium]|nr:hypothetical protein [Lachnospiraceae bacterium]